MMRNPASTNGNKLVTSMVTDVDTLLSYVTLITPRNNFGGKPVYSVSPLIPKTNEAVRKEMMACAKAAYIKGEEILRKNGVIPSMDDPDFYFPIRDGDKERPDDPAYKNCWFLTAKSVNQPVVVDASCKPLTDLTRIFSGCYGRVAINFYAFRKGNKFGISVGLNGIQLVREGKPLGSHFDAQQAFTPLETEETEESSDDDFLQ